MLTQEQRQRLLNSSTFQSLSNGRATQESGNIENITGAVERAKQRMADLEAQKKQEQQDIIDNEPVRKVGALESSLAHTGNFLTSSYKDVKERVSKTKEGFDRMNRGEQSMPETSFQGAGQVVGAVGDVAFNLAKQFVPDKVKEVIKSGISKVAGSEAGQDVMSSIDKWAEEHPRAAANLDAAINIASVVPVGKGVSVAQKGIKTAEKALPKIIEKGAVKAGNVADNLVNLSAEKIVANKQKKLAEYVAPRLTSKAKEAVYKQGNMNSATFLKAEKFIPNKHWEEVASSVKGIIKGKNIGNDTKRLISAIKTEGSSIIKKAKESNAIWNKNIIKGKIEEAKKGNVLKTIFKGDKEQARLFKSVEDTWNDIVSKNKKTADGLIKARQQFDQTMTEAYPNLFVKKEGGVYHAVKTIRDAVNKHANEIIGDDTFSKSMEKQTHMIEALKNISAKGGKTTNLKKSGLGELLGDIVPTARWMIPTGVVGGAVGARYWGK